MASAHKAVRIDRPADVVFDFLADGTNNPTWQPAVVDVASDETAPGVGATYRQSVRHPLGFRVPADYRLTVFERPRRLAFEVSSGGPLRPTGTFELSAPTPAATDVRYTLDYRPRGWMTLATPLMPLVHLVFRWQTSWLRNAKTTLEARSPQPAAG